MDLIGLFESLWAFASGNWPLLLGVVLSLYIVGSLLCLADLFTKAGQAEWKAWVPGLRAYTYWKIAWDGRRYLDVLNFILALAVFSVFISFLQQTGRYVLMAVGAALGVYLICLRVQLCLHAARRFGKNTAFGVIALFLLKPVGLMILSLGRADYDPARDTPKARLSGPAAKSAIERSEIG